MDIPGSPELHQLALMAIDHGAASAQDGPVIPFTVEEDSHGTRHLTRFSSGTLEASVAAAHDHANRSTAARIALCFDGFVTVEEGRFDAVWVIAQEQDDEAALTFFQRYSTAHSPQGYGLIGNTGYGGENDPILDINET